MSDETLHVVPAPEASTTPLNAKPAVPAKETKAQKSERLKLEKNPWEAWDEVREYAKQGREHVDKAWTGLYFKWWGIYTQGDGVGATGGVGGEGKESEFFMMRIGLPNGMLSSHQLRVIGAITKKHARNLADITTRQNIQLHWLTIQSLVEITDQLTEIGLSPKGACGDVVRNVTGCPLAGLDRHELLDASPLAQELAHHLTANPKYYNLPRKFKICVTGCPLWCSYPEINDVALTAIKRGDEVGYTLRVGGGLSLEPHMAVRIPAFVQQAQAMEVVEAVVEIFREQTELRENRKAARIKYLFMKHGWTADSMLLAIEEKLGYKLDADPMGAAFDDTYAAAANPRQTVPEDVPDDIYRDHVGITPQRQPGLSAVGASVLRGRLSGDQLEAMAALAEQHGDGHLRTTIMQSIVFVNIRNEAVQQLIADLARAIELAGRSQPLLARSRGLHRHTILQAGHYGNQGLQQMAGGRNVRAHAGLSTSRSSCMSRAAPTSCGQHWIADIGLEGKKLKVDGVLKDAYYFCVGGSVGKYAGPARTLGYRCAADDVPEAVERLLKGYLVNSQRARGRPARLFCADQR